MDKLFDAVKTAYDPKNRETFICKDENGDFYVYKPRTGFRSRSFKSATDEKLLAIFERQRHCGHNQASYWEGEAPDAEVKPEDETTDATEENNNGGE